MNKKLYAIALLIAMFGLQSCKPKKTVSYSLTIFTQKLNGDNNTGYPDEFKKLLLPIQADIDKNISVIFSCISKEHTVTIQRIDGEYKMPLAINTDAKLGKVMSGNKGAENRLNKAFENLEMPDDLKKENTTPDFNKLSYFDKNIYIYSTKYEQDSILILNKKYRVFNQIDRLRESLLQELAKKQKEGKNIGDCAILYNVDLSSISEVVKPSVDPSAQIINTQPSPSPVQQEQPQPADKKDDKGGVYVPPPQSSLCQQQHPSFDKFFAILADKSIGSDCKSDMIKKDYLKYFTLDAQIENVSNNDCEGPAQDILDFLTTYINTGYHIYPQNCSTDIKPGGRYKLLHVQVVRAK